MATFGSCVESDTKSDVSEETNSRPLDVAVAAMLAMVPKSKIEVVVIFVWVSTKSAAALPPRLSKSSKVETIEPIDATAQDSMF
jgi:hypothetical protein